MYRPAFYCTLPNTFFFFNKSKVHGNPALRADLSVPKRLRLPKGSDDLAHLKIYIVFFFF